MNQTTSYIDFLLSVILSDGIVKTEEIGYFLKIINLWESDQTSREQIQRKLLKTEPIDIEKLIAYIAESYDSMLLLSLMKDAYAIAKSDGEISQSEIELINSLLNSAKVPKENWKQIQLWAEEYLYVMERGLLLFTT